ncbi:precorrin-2 dehydrogenase [Metabacillus sp. GX 13764]|uniref:precorrin-2 dehydrogenase/sirohydrochlorin ferrochelatase family protein n=1 Tax=Metabacillus kandeliae TaxID=2900151 RepID=UPI001E64309C|nr:NAD(P)-dependent oxidoreductase [Metabacillus kandeliae]MCD7033847.1 precorrin-2 dehydrogenase [Metabacillus kandeliae]
MIPLLIDLKNEPVLIAGGGSIALRRLQLLLEEEALLTIISPEAGQEIADLAKNGRITWHQREISLEDLEGYRLIIAATNDSELNSKIADAARKHTLVNVVSRAENGNIQVPKIVKKGKLTLSVSTGGASPALAKEIGGKIEQLLDNDIEAQLDEQWKKRKDPDLG